MVRESEGEVTSCVAIQERTAPVAALVFTGGGCSAIGVGHVVLPAAVLTCSIPDTAQGSVLPHSLLSVIAADLQMSGGL